MRYETSPITLLEITCPKDGKKIKIHECVLSKCPYENGHTISSGTSYVDCDYPKSQLSTKDLSKLATRARNLSNDLKNVGYTAQAQLLEPVVMFLVKEALEAFDRKEGP